MKRTPGGREGLYLMAKKFLDPANPMHIRCDACGKPKQHMLKDCNTNSGLCIDCRRWLNGESDTPPRALEEATRPKGIKKQ